MMYISHFVFSSQNLFLSEIVKIFLFVTSSNIDPSLPDPGGTEKNNLNFFHTSLWYRKRFYEVLKGLHEIFEPPQRSVKNLS